MLNEMMDRPINDPKVTEYMRTSQRKFTGNLRKIELEANKRRVPIIPHETAVFLDVYLDSLKPRTILEIGTAIGFSASLMADRPYVEEVTTIDRYDLMINEAKQNFAQSGLGHKITLLEGDANDVLPALVEEKKQFDFIFMDSAKAKYIEFLPHCLDLLPVGGFLLIDDIFQGGTILEPEETIPRRIRKIHRKLNELIETVQMNPSLKSSLIPLGDGVLLIEKVTNY